MKKYKNLILKIVFLIGILLLLYPTIGSIINRYRQLKVIDKYAKTVHIIKEEDSLEMYNEAISYNERLFELQKEDKRYDLGNDYKNILKVDSTNVMGYIDIPKANIKLPIYHGVDDSVLQNGVGHVRESSLPIGTNNQNSLLMGHTGLPTSKIFTNLEKIKIGDYFRISVLGKNLYYKVFNVEIIEPKDLINKLYVEEGRDLVTLVTCTPYGVNSHRLVIQAERMAKKPIIKDSNATKNNVILFIIIGSCLTILFIGLYLIVRQTNNNINEKNVEEMKKVATNKNSTHKKKRKKKKKKKSKKNINKNKKKRGKKNAKKR